LRDVVAASNARRERASAEPVPLVETAGSGIALG
jgi:hypothetical protein